MNDTPDQTFWERLAARAQPAGALATMEDPMSIVRLGTGTSWAASVSSVLFAGVFFWFDEPIAAWSTVLLAVTFFTVWVWYSFTDSSGSVRTAFFITLVAGTADNLIVHVALGGYANSGAYWMWGITLTVASALVLKRRETLAVGIFFVVVAIVLGFLEPTLAANRPPPDQTLTSILFVIVFIGNLVMVAPLLVFFLERLGRERALAERLLLNVLPAEVADELKETGSTTARHYDGISVLFADIVGFTPLSASMEPEEMVNQLNDVFTYFDTLAEQYGVEKIRAIGDNYLVAAGVPVPRDDHAEALAGMALDMLEYSQQGLLSFRIGINSGPAVAGVIGTKKFQYDIWGDTVNTASRMESHGEPGRIQISEATYQQIKDDFDTTLRGPIQVKGKGTLTTWYLEHRRQTATAATL